MSNGPVVGPSIGSYSAVTANPSVEPFVSSLLNLRHPDIPIKKVTVRGKSMNAKLLKMLTISSALLFLLGFSSHPASANAVYVYTGNPFNQFSPGVSCSGSCAMTVTMTLSAPLGDNLIDASVTPLSFSISDGALNIGAVTLNQNNALAGSNTFQFFTDGSGNITNWEIQVFPSSSSGQPLFLLTDSFGNDPNDCAASNPFGTGCLALNQFDPGTWTLQISTGATPEPSSLLLLGTGLLGLGPFIRRRLSN